MKLSQWLAILDSKPVESALRSKGAERFDMVPAMLCAVDPEISWGDKPAIEVIAHYMLIFTEIRKIKGLPLYKNQTVQDEEESKPKPWDYDGRNSISIVHTLAQAYGWTVKYILNLDAYIAIQLLQEILLQEQFERERQYNLSDIAYSYDKGSKKMKHRPMERPDWMVFMHNVVIVKKKIPDIAMPKGTVKRL